MIRLPIGSVPPAGARNRMRPWPTIVFGTVSASVTFVQAAGLSAANHSATCLDSSSETSFAIVFMRAASFLAPLLNPPSAA
jgi:hypothetical protein